MQATLSVRNILMASVAIALIGCSDGDLSPEGTLSERICGNWKRTLWFENANVPECATRIQEVKIAVDSWDYRAGYESPFGTGVIEVDGKVFPMEVGRFEVEGSNAGFGPWLQILPEEEDSPWASCQGDGRVLIMLEENPVGPKMDRLLLGFEENAHGVRFLMKLKRAI
jgi:hypothetical protein